jgi:thiol:disulfide interchange protein DsbC
MRLVSKLCVVILAVLVSTQSVLADEAADKLKVMDAIAMLNLPATPDEISKSDVPGFYEVRYGMQFLYVSADGKYVFHGALLRPADGTNLTETRRGDIRMSFVKDIPESEMIIFEPREVKRTITVFTDIDCGFCRRLHSHINEFMRQGIRVRYVLNPRAGIGSPSYKKAVSVWCARDRNKALTEAKQGVLLGEKDCDNPVQKHMAVGDAIGVQGTPTILIEDGTHIGGYLTPKQMQATLAARPVRDKQSTN